MKSFKQHLQESKVPSIKKIAQSLGGKTGEGEDCDGGYWAHGGRCQEFRKSLKEKLKDHGYKVVPHDHPDARKPGHIVEWDSEYHGLHGNPPEKHKKMFLHGHNNHNWLQVTDHNGTRHYDSMNPEGVKHPHQFKFFKDVVKNS